MASSADVREIMGMAPVDTTITKEQIIGSDKKRSKKSGQPTFTRPEGMHRELYNLLYSENKELPCPLMPTDTSKDQGYKQMRAKLGMRRVRPWKWMPFSNPARKDGLVLHHWRRVQDEGKDYPFARFNKCVEVPTYTELEYQHHLATPGWTRQETDHLMDLAQRFDTRFVVMHDRWDRNNYSDRSVEDLKERYYNIVEKLERVHGGSLGGSNSGDKEKKQFLFDADHERRRKEQLRRLYSRTPEQVEEEEMLKAELRKIEARKKEREKKTADLQKLIAQADGNMLGDGKKLGKKKLLANRARQDSALIEQAGIKFPDLKSSGVSLRSQRMKLPSSVGLKKTKAIETMVAELGLEPQPIPTDDVCTEFNELRSEMVLLYELKNALATCEFDLTSLKHQYEALKPGKSLEIPEKIRVSTSTIADNALAAANATDRKKSLADVIDVVGTSRDPPTNRKRKAALEQSNILKKIKKRTYM